MNMINPYEKQLLSKVNQRIDYAERQLQVATSPQEIRRFGLGEGLLGSQGAMVRQRPDVKHKLNALREKAIIRMRERFEKNQDKKWWVESCAHCSRGWCPREDVERYESRLKVLIKEKQADASSKSDLQIKP